MISAPLTIRSESSLVSVVPPDSHPSRFEADHSESSVVWCKSIFDQVVHVFVEVSVELGTKRFSEIDKIGFKVGDRICLEKSVHEELCVSIGGLPKYLCRFGRAGEMKAVQITKMSSKEVSAMDDFGNTAHSEKFERTALESAVDLPLRLEVEFGKTNITLGEVLQLREGSVVELSSRLNEPLTVLLNGSRFAEGNLITIDGKFGIQFTRILSGFDLERVVE